MGCADAIGGAARPHPAELHNRLAPGFRWRRRRPRTIRPQATRPDRRGLWHRPTEHVASAQTSGSERRRGSWPRHIHLDHLQPQAPPGQWPQRFLRCSTTRRTPDPSARSSPPPPAAAWAPFAQHLHARRAPVPLDRARGPTGRLPPARITLSLAPNAPPLAKTWGGLTTGRAPRRVGVPDTPARPIGSAGRHPIRPQEWSAATRQPATSAGPGPCRQPPHASETVSPTAHPPSAGGHGHERESGGAVSPAKPPAPSATSGATKLGECAPQSMLVGRRRPSLEPEVFGRKRSHASTIVCHPVQRQRWACRAQLHPVLAGRVGAAVAQPLQPHDDPRGTEAALAGPRGGKRISPLGSRRPVRDHPRVVTDRPLTLRAGVTHATRGWPSTMHSATSALALRTAPILGAVDASNGRATTRGSDNPLSATDTGSPSTTSWIRPEAVSLATSTRIGFTIDAHRPPLPFTGCLAAHCSSEHAVLVGGSSVPALAACGGGGSGRELILAAGFATGDRTPPSVRAGLPSSG